MNTENRSNLSEGCPTASHSDTGSYVVDAEHSRLAFTVSYFGIGHVNGRFANYNGRIWYDPAAPERTEAIIQVDAASVDTSNGERDKFLKSRSFLNAQEYPQISFKSTRVRPLSGCEYEVQGDLNLLGRSQPVSIQASILAVEDEGHRRERLTLSAACVIDRRDFGLGWDLLPEMADGLVGNTVRLMFEMSAVLEAPERA